jgi:hypothetical protein
MVETTTVVTVKVRCDSHHDFGYYPKCERNWQVEGESKTSCIRQIALLGWLVSEKQTICPDCYHKWVEQKDEVLGWKEFQEREPEKAKALKREHFGLDAYPGDLAFVRQERPDLPWRASYPNNDPFSPWYWRESDKQWVC